MKHAPLVHLLLPGLLLLILAGCGNNSPVPPPAPPPTPAPVPGPVDPAPIPGPIDPGPVDPTPIPGPTPVPTPPPSGEGISGTVFAASGGDVAGTLVGACLVVNQTADCGAPSTVITTINVSSSSAPYTLAAPAGDYIVVAQQDVDGDGGLDYEGGYGYDPASDAYQSVTPPAQGIDITLQAVGGTDPGPTPPPSGEGISGTWSGTTTTQSFGSEQTTLSLTQSDTQVSGTLTLTDSGGGSFSTDVTGSVSGSTATVSGLFTLEGGGTLEYRYEGTFSETAYSGTVTLLVDGAAQEQGEFSVTKGANALSPLEMHEPQAVRPNKRPAW